VRFARPVAVYYVTAVTVMVCALLWMYWTGHFADLQSWLSVTGLRVTGTIAITSAFGLAQLVSSMLGARAAQAPPRRTVSEWLGVSEPAPVGSSQASAQRSPTT
jgi:hypothetical protein